MRILKRSFLRLPRSHAELISLEIKSENPLQTLLLVWLYAENVRAKTSLLNLIVVENFNIFYFVRSLYTLILDQTLIFFLFFI